MDSITKQALIGSIEKWEEIVDGSGIEIGVRSCPLCTEFFDNNCKGCPIYAHTQQHGCRNTPYIDWCDYKYIMRPLSLGRGKVFDNHSKQLAINELNFLKSLLPPEPCGITLITKDKIQLANPLVILKLHIQNLWADVVRGVKKLNK